MTEYLDSDLLLKIKEDNQSAFEVVFLRYYSGLCAYASSILGDKDASEEVVQDLFVKFWENRKVVHINSSLKAYFYRTVHNQCLNQIESWRIRNQYTKNQIQNFNDGDLIPFSGDYPIANLIVKELEDKIRESINALPSHCRDVFVLIRFQNKSYQEVADKLHISINTVKTQMQRAVEKLKEMLQEYLPVIICILLPQLLE